MIDGLTSAFKAGVWLINTGMKANAIAEASNTVINISQRRFRSKADQWNANAQLLFVIAQLAEIGTFYTFSKKHAGLSIGLAGTIEASNILRHMTNTRYRQKNHWSRKEVIIAHVALGIIRIATVSVMACPQIKNRNTISESLKSIQAIAYIILTIRAYQQNKERIKEQTIRDSNQNQLRISSTEMTMTTSQQITSNSTNYSPTFQASLDYTIDFYLRFLLPPKSS